MAYSNNVKQLILAIVRQGRSPEVTLDYLSQHIYGDENEIHLNLKKLADSLSVPFTPVDCHEVSMNLPSPKTIRYWVSKELRTGNRNQFNQDNIEEKHTGILNSQGRYSEEWEHFNKIKEAIIKLQYATGGEVGELLDLITGERVTLDDSRLQKNLDEFIEAIHETMNLGLSVPHYLINPVISRTSRRMNKRYKRN